MLVSFICVCAECVVLRCASDWAAAQCLPACGRVCTSCLGCVSSTPHRTVTLVRVACTSVGTISAPMANNTFASGRTRALRMNELPTKRGGIGGGGAFFLSCMHVVVVAYAEPSFVAIRTVSTVALWRGDVCVCRRQSLGARLSRCRSSASLAQRTGMSSDLHVCTCVLVHLCTCARVHVCTWLVYLCTCALVCLCTCARPVENCPLWYTNSSRTTARMHCTTLYTLTLHVCGLYSANPDGDVRSLWVR
jgi:hypothetical protein